MLKFSKSFLVIAIILLLTLLPFTVNAVDLNLSENSSNTYSNTSTENTSTNSSSRESNTSANNSATSTNSNIATTSTSSAKVINVKSNSGLSLSNILNILLIVVVIVLIFC